MINIFVTWLYIRKRKERKNNRGFFDLSNINLYSKMDAVNFFSSTVFASMTAVQSSGNWDYRVHGTAAICTTDEMQIHPSTFSAILTASIWCIVGGQIDLSSASRPITSSWLKMDIKGMVWCCLSNSMSNSILNIIYLMYWPGYLPLSRHLRQVMNAIILMPNLLTRNLNTPI